MGHLWSIFGQYVTHYVPDEEPLSLEIPHLCGTIPDRRGLARGGSRRRAGCAPLPRPSAESDVPAARSEAGTSVAGRCRLVATGEREVDDLVTVTRPHGAISARLNALVSPPAPPGTDDRHHAARSACGLWLRGCGREAQ